MKLQIDSQRAISLIEEKIRELDAYSFDSESWRESCYNSLSNIFSGVEIPYQIRKIDFTPIYSQDKAKSLTDAKSTARNLLQSYIQLIRDFQVSEISVLQRVTDERNNLIRSVNSLQTENLHLRELIAESVNKVSALEKEVVVHKAKYVDFDTITPKQLREFISGISLKKLWPYLLVIGVLASGASGLGTWVASIKTNQEVKH